MTRVILIASGKGGVGKTTVSANLAAALTKIGYDILVVDADIKTGHLGTHFGLKQQEGSLNDVLQGKMSIHNVIYYHPAGIKFIPTGASLKLLETKNKKGIEEVILDLVGSVDIIIIDSAAGMGEDIKSIMNIADEILLVANPELPSMIEAFKMHKLAIKRGLKALGVVVNQYQGKKYELTMKNIEEFTELPVIGVIPHDESVKRAVHDKVPVVINEPNSKPSKEFNKIAAKIVGKQYVYYEPTILQKIRKIFAK